MQLTGRETIQWQVTIPGTGKARPHRVCILWGESSKPTFVFSLSGHQ